MLVETAAYDSDTHACNSSKECAEPGNSTYPRAAVKTAATTSFQEQNPENAELTSNVAFTNEQMSGVLAWMEEHNASAEEGAVCFLTSNPDIWTNWLSDAVREKLSALLK